MTNVYEIVMDSNGNALYAQPAFRFVYGMNTTVPCVAATGFSPGLGVPCTNGKQTFPMYNFPGVITQHPTGFEDYSVAGAWQIPLNFHGACVRIAHPLAAAEAPRFGSWKHGLGTRVACVHQQHPTQSVRRQHG